MTREELIDDTLKRAQAEVGTRERRPNWSPRIEQYLLEAGIRFPAPWCAAFTFSMIDRTCRDLGIENPVIRSAYCPTIETWAADHEIRYDRPQRGDLFLYRSGGRARHIGFVTHANGTRYGTIEGNTNIDGSAEGVGVFARSRPITDSYRFVRWAALVVPTVQATVALEVSGQDWGRIPILNGRAFAPVRWWGEKLNFSVEWVQETQEVRLEGYPLPSEITLLNGVAHVPVRVLAAFSGLRVEWDGERDRVTVKKA